MNRGRHRCPLYLHVATRAACISCCSSFIACPPRFRTLPAAWRR
jgi:hypothetical protein